MMTRVSLAVALMVAALVAAPPRADARRPAAGRAVTVKKPRAASPAAKRERVGDRSGSGKPTPAATTAAGAGDADAAGGADATAATTSTTTSGGKTLKTKTYTFGAMDVEGKLKTPQLLYFLDRVKLELEMSAPDKRSFMKELEKSADDNSL
ncbi:MAG TPA: hypothetical protein VMU50_23535 [Polyangia bacterium]|nr:hypothetical protein [Polyangia bacterium]